MSKLTIVRGDDWEGIYVDGTLAMEGHSIDTPEAIELAIERKATSSEVKWCDMKWLNDEGNLPLSLSAVKFNAAG